MKNWKAIAIALDAGIPEADLPRVTAPLDSLETAFRPLVATLGPGDEAAPVVTKLLEDEGR